MDAVEAGKFLQLRPRRVLELGTAIYPPTPSAMGHAAYGDSGCPNWLLPFAPVRYTLLGSLPRQDRRLLNGAVSTWQFAGRVPQEW